MIITIEIGPNRVTRFLSRIRYSVVSAKNGLKEGWQQYKPASKPAKLAGIVATKLASGERQ